MALRIHNPSGGTRSDGMPAFGGATASRSGHSGSVPAPQAGEQNYALLGSGEFGPIQVSDIYNFLGEGAGSFVTVQSLFNAVINALQSRTTWHYLTGSAGPGEGGGESGGSSGTTTLVDTYNITGVGAGEEVTTQQIVDAIISRFDERTTWNVLETPVTPDPEDEEETEPSDEPNDDNDGIVLNEQSSDGDLYDQINNSYEGSDEPEEPNNNDSAVES